MIKEGEALNPPLAKKSVVSNTKRTGIFSRRNVLILLVLVVAGLIFWWSTIDRTPKDGLTKKQEEEYRALQEDMKKSEVKDGLDGSVFLEINSSLKNEKYADAKKQIETQLQTANLLEKDKRALLTLLGQACLPLKDFPCIDSVIVEYGKLLDYDFYYLVDAAKSAKSSGNEAKAKEYYQKAFQEIEKLGGKDFVKQANDHAQVSLNYDEIKTGAGQ